MNAHGHTPGSERSDARSSALDWARSAGLGPELAQTVRAQVRRRRRRRITTIAATACLLLATVAYWRPAGNPAAATAVAVDSAAVLTPERRVLTDGSRVELRHGAEVRVDFTAQERRITLLRGEAHFQVTRDAARPFVVAAQGVQVRAIGTAFCVGVAERSVEVLVTEGVVAVAPPLSPAASARVYAAPAGQMTAGQRTVVALAAHATHAAPAVEEISAPDLARRLAWRVPRLQFSGTPLTEVVALFRAHGGVQLRLAEAALGTVRVSGVLRANNSDALLRLLAADHEIVSEQVGQDIVLRRGRP